MSSGTSAPENAAAARAFGPVSITVADGVATVVVDHPPVNAMGREVLGGLEQAAAALRDDQDVRVIVLTGAGDKAFLAGADISEFQSNAAKENGVAEQARWALSVLDAWAALPQPVIAAVQAHAMGGGLEMALLCDLIVAGPKVKLGLPEVKLGLIPGGGGTQRLPRRIGAGPAKRMLYLGAAVDAQQALEMGLVDQVAAEGKVLEEAQALAARIAAMPRVAVQAIKKAMDADLRAGLEREQEQFKVAAASNDFKEGFSAFLEKRPPRFTHT
jgi:enoyl-CoA hydratase/carnithine racemase